MAITAPTAVSNTDDTIGSVTFTFTDQSSGAAWHRLYRRLKSVGGNTWVRAGETDDLSDTSVIDQDPNLDNNTTYEYAITAFDADEESTFSSIVEVTTPEAAAASSSSGRLVRPGSLFVTIVIEGDEVVDAQLWRRYGDG